MSELKLRPPKESELLHRRWSSTWLQGLKPDGQQAACVGAESPDLLKRRSCHTDAKVVGDALKRAPT
jgi:hypothetical protein